MPDLTDNERIVLMIAAQGESMIPIGQWREPINRLVELGYLRRADEFNNLITDAGRKAVGEANEAIDDAAARVLIARHNASAAYRRFGNDIADRLVEMAHIAVQATGDELPVALQKCVAVVRDRALELLDVERG